MITEIFTNISNEDLRNSNDLCNIWKKVCSGIKSNRDSHYGEKIAAHSNVVDLKNGILLVETDHSGWNQILQMYSKFILRGLHMNLPQLTIETLAFRTKGSEANLVLNYAEEYEKAADKMKRKIEQDEKESEDFCNRNLDKKSEKKSEIPPEFQAKLDSLFNSLLTNSKK